MSRSQYFHNVQSHKKETQNCDQNKRVLHASESGIFSPALVTPGRNRTVTGGGVGGAVVSRMD